MPFLNKIFLSKKIKRFAQNELDNNLIKECKKISIINNTQNIKLLIKNGANINTQDKYIFEDKNGVRLLSTGQTTPLMFACMLKPVKIVEFLLKKGADPNLKSSTGQTALMMATIRGRFEIVKLLLEYGADFNIKDHNNTKAIDIAINFLNIHSLRHINPYPSFNIPTPLYIFQSLSHQTAKNQIVEYTKIKDYLILWKNIIFIQRRYRKKLQQRFGKIELLSKTIIPEVLIEKIINLI